MSIANSKQASFQVFTECCLSDTRADAKCSKCRLMKTGVFLQNLLTTKFTIT